MPLYVVVLFLSLNVVGTIDMIAPESTQMSLVASPTSSAKQSWGAQLTCLSGRFGLGVSSAFWGLYSCLVPPFEMIYCYQKPLCKFSPE